MALSKTDELIITTLATRRAELASVIETFNPRALEDVQTEFNEIEAKLKSIDPTIPSLAELAAQHNHVKT